MSAIKRVSQETFDEVVRENIEEFEMSAEEALKDAIDQFSKQGVDLSVIDLTGGIGKEEFTTAVRNLDISIKEIQSDSANDGSSIVELLETTLRNLLFDSPTTSSDDLSRRNRRLFCKDGGFNILHTLITESNIERKPMLTAAMDLLTKLSKIDGMIDSRDSFWFISSTSVIIVDIRDFFEPNGSKNIVTLLNKELGGTCPTIEVVVGGLNLAKTVAKSENNKGMASIPSTTHV